MPTWGAGQKWDTLVNFSAVSLDSLENAPLRTNLVNLAVAPEAASRCGRRMPAVKFLLPVSNYGMRLMAVCVTVSKVVTDFALAW